MIKKSQRNFNKAIQSLYDRRLRQRAQTMLEMIVALTLFSMAMVVIAIVMAPIFATRFGQLVGPHTERLQMELLSRQIERDLLNCPVVYGYDGEVCYQSLSAPGTAGDPLDAERPLTGTFSLIDNPGPQSFLLNNTNEIYTNTLHAYGTDPNQTAYTLVFFNNNGTREAVYHVSAQNTETTYPWGITYEVQRLSTNGLSERVMFQIVNDSGTSTNSCYSMANPDQDLPKFWTDTNGLQHFLLPNPFSQSVTPSDAVHLPKSVFGSPMELSYSLPPADSD